MRTTFQLTRPQAALGKAWLTMAITTVIFAEIFALLTAAARTPGVYQWLPSANFFQISLVTHVNLAIVIWFLAFGALLSVIAQVLPAEISPQPYYLAWSGWLCSTCGMVLVVLCPFLGAEESYMSNYIPVLNHPLFFTALGLFFTGILITMTLPFWMKSKIKSIPFHPEFSYGVILAGLVFIMALLCFFLAFFQLKTFPRDLFYFETLFWGGGHLLQFVYTLAMLSCWILLAQSVFQQLPLSSRILRLLLSMILIFAIPGPLFYLVFDIASPELTDAFTFLMRWGLGATTIIIGGAILRLHLRKNVPVSWRDPCYSSLMISMALFGYGGIIGTLINVSNVKIPAHYHGVIGAVTLSFMGASYVILPLLHKPLIKYRLLPWQPILCGIGGVLFVTGLFWAGSHGVARKIPGTAQGLDNFGKIAGMTLMGLGGFITLTGALIFIYIFLKSLLSQGTTKE